MHTNPSSESGSFRPRIVLALLLCCLAAMIAAVSFATTPASGTLSPGNRKIEFTGGPFVIPTNSSDNATGPVTCDAANPCEDFGLTIDIPQSYIDANPKDEIHVTITWDDPSGGQDLDTWLVNNPDTGTYPAHAANGGDNPEVIVIGMDKVQAGAHQYFVRVAPFISTGQPFKGTVELVSGTQAGPAPTPQPFVGIAPRYYNYQPGPGLGETAGEPTIGFNPKTHHAMYISGLQTFRVTFPEDLAPTGTISGACDALWEDVSFVLTKTKSLDPILFTDQGTGRTFVSQLDSVVPPASPVLIGLNSLMAYTDDDGQSYTPAQLNPPDGSYDHQSVGGGPYPAPFPPGITPLYPHAVYYCSQAGVTAFCSRSDDGGLNFNPSRPIYTLLDGCGGIHGHVKVAPDGTVYVPNRGCNGVQSLAVSEDAGETWTVRQVKGEGFSAKPPPGILDPSVGIASDGTLYFAWVSSEADGGHAHVAISHDKGVTWTNDYDLGASQNLPNNVFMAAVAGDPDRAAVGFLGTTEPGDHQADAFKGTWYLYIATTYDGGKTWATVNATPNAPVQREAGIWNQGGSSPLRNLLDFTDITIDHRGRVLYSYADGCIGECEAHGPNSFSAKASIARQSGGRGLLAQFDSAEPTGPQSACLSGTRDALASYLRWNVPDNGGSDLLYYDIYRGTTANNMTKVGRAEGGKRSFNDRSTNSSVPTYFYKIVAHNAVGDGPASNIIQLDIGPTIATAGACVLPGQKVLDDPLGDESDTLPQHDITSVSMAEPQQLNGKLVFTIKVQNLQTPIPNWRYAVRFGAPLHPPDATGVGPQDDWFVSYVSGTNEFTYGTTGVAQGAARAFTTIGTLDPASKVDPDGTITLVLPKSAIGNPKPGDAITSIFGSVRLNGPTGGTNETIPDSTGTGSYALRSADLCLPNDPPVARLSADSDGGQKSLTVTFDASASSDPDAGDTIATYTFNWGDGSDDVVQSSPVISHTFDTEGLYAVKLVVTDSRGKGSLNTAQHLVQVSSNSPSQLVNISTRASVINGDNVSIGGFIVTGNGSKNVVIRAIGPSLKSGDQPVVGRMDDPTLELYDGAGSLIASNDNWGDTQQTEVENSGLQPPDPRESAIVRSLSAGAYTAVLRGKDGGSGIALVEIYDRDTNPITSLMANISTRAVVGEGDNAMIGGFIAGRGTGSALMLLRAIGPSLKSTLPTALDDPTLELYDANGSLLFSNDNWKDTQQSEIEHTGLAPANNAESAILAPVAPGNYTAVMRGANNSVGTGLIEIYNIQ